MVLTNFVHLFDQFKFKVDCHTRDNSDNFCSFINQTYNSCNWSCNTTFFFQGKKMDSTPLAMYNYFIDRVKSNLHIVLAMSPIGDAFRNRLRMFPSLINCCTIDWFQVRISTIMNLYIDTIQHLCCVVGFSISISVWG